MNNTFFFIRFSVKGRIKPQPKIYDNLCSKGTHFRAILYDKTSTIQIVAFNADCEIALKQLQVNKNYCFTNFKLNKMADIRTVISNKKYINIIHNSDTV